MKRCQCPEVKCFGKDNGIVDGVFCNERMRAAAEVCLETSNTLSDNPEYSRDAKKCLDDACWMFFKSLDTLTFYRYENWFHVYGPDALACNIFGYPLICEHRSGCRKRLYMTGFRVRELLLFEKHWIEKQGKQLIISEGPHPQCPN